MSEQNSNNTGQGQQSGMGQSGQQGQSGMGQSGQQGGATGGSGQQQQFDQSGGQQGGGNVQAQQIQPDMDVEDAQGNRIGTVDHVEGDRIKLSRSDSADGRHHYVSIDQVESVDDGTVCLRQGANPTA